jgi:hypothetical protein
VNWLNKAEPYGEEMIMVNKKTIHRHVIIKKHVLEWVKAHKKPAGSASKKSKEMWTVYDQSRGEMIRETLLRINNVDLETARNLIKKVKTEMTRRKGMYLIMRNASISQSICQV